MEKYFRFLMFLLSVLLLIPAYADTGTSPAVILAKSKDVYLSLKTYKSRANVVLDFDKGKSVSNINILLKKPNLYRITWKVDSTKETHWPAHSTGAVWNDGTGPYSYSSIEHGARASNYAKLKSDAIAISNATGSASSGVSTIPEIFLFAPTGKDSIFDGLINPSLDGTEKIDNDDCYVISGSSQVSSKEIIWISKSTYLIRKYSRAFAPPTGFKAPEMTDEQIDPIIIAEGLKITPDVRKEEREKFKGFALKAKELKGGDVETYMDISSPEIGNDEFKFTLPKDAVQTHKAFLGEV